VAIAWAGKGHDPWARLPRGAGPIILAYADGLVEPRGELLAQGLDRLCVAGNIDLALDQLLDRVIAALVPGGPPNDIATLVGMRWHP
jgi:hypothetical protein